MSLHVEDAGQGLPIVLLHGIGSSSKSWRRQLAELSKDFRVIAWDAPGYGKSADPPPVTPSIREYVESLRGLIDRLDLPRIALLGHSMGGIIAQEFARAYAERLLSLILADTSQVALKEKWDARLAVFRSNAVQEFARLRAPMLLSGNAPQELIDEATSIMAEVRPVGYEFAVKAMATADTREALAGLQVPILLIWGSEDEITPVWRDIPHGARLEIISGAGHLCYAERPDQFNTIVRDFLKS